jgi:hypothetical protein
MENPSYSDNTGMDFYDADGNLRGSILFSSANDFQIFTQRYFHILAEGNQGEHYNVLSISPDPTTGLSEAYIEGSLFASGQIYGNGQISSPILRTEWLNFHNGFSIEQSGDELLLETTENRYFRFGSDGAGAFVQSPAGYNRTTSQNPNVTLTSDMTFRRSTSAKKYKDDIQPIKFDPKLLLKVKPVSWLDKAEVRQGKIERRYFGLIADEVEAAGLGDYVTYDNGKVDGLMYDRLLTLLIPIVKEHEEKIMELELKIQQLEGEKK